MNNYAIEVNDLKKSYKTYESLSGEKVFLSSLRRKSKIKHALKGVSFAVKKGEIVALLGENGSGKSTLIKLLTGILHPDSGTAMVLGYVPWKERVALAQRMGVVLGAHTQLWWNLPAIDSFNYMRYMYGIDEREFHQRLDYFMDVLNLKDVYKRAVRQLSLGERMKCNFAASLLHMPELVFLDEPTIGVDLPSSFALRDTLLSLRKKYGITFIIATHIIDDVKILSERVLILDEGRKVFDGPKSRVGKMFGDLKQVEIYFNDMGSVDISSYGTVVEKKTNYVRLEIPGGMIKNRRFASLLSSGRVLDYNISEPDFGYILHKFYSKLEASKGVNRRRFE